MNRDRGQDIPSVVDKAIGEHGSNVDQWEVVEVIADLLVVMILLICSSESRVTKWTLKKYGPTVFIF